MRPIDKGVKFWRIEKMSQLMEYYQKEFPQDMTWGMISSKLDSLNDHPDIQVLRQIFCNELASMLTEGFVKYSEKEFEFRDDSLWKVTLDNIEKLTKDHYFYWAFYYYAKKQYRKCKEFIHKVCQSEQESGNPMDEAGILDLFLVPFKNAPEEIWDFITREIKAINTMDRIGEFCDLISLYYKSANNDEVVDALLDFMQKYPDYKTPNEMLGFTYYSMSMGNNAIACFEKVDEMFYFPMPDIYWMLAWSSGKIKNLSYEEMYYRKSLKLAPDMIFSLNNLGYCLYKQKRYREALEVFDRCLKEKKDLSCAGNNYVRVLIALGRNADSKKFIRSGEVKVVKALKDKVAKLDNHNAHLKKDVVPEPQDWEEEQSTEKVTLDIIIPVGRLDLLCEDNVGNLYIFELKKDSGYDDAYTQIAEYLDWFEQSEKFKDKKIYRSNIVLFEKVSSRSYIIPWGFCYSSRSGRGKNKKRTYIRFELYI